MFTQQNNVSSSRTNPACFAWRSILFFVFIAMVAIGTLMSSGCSSKKTTKSEWIEKVNKSFPKSVFTRTLANCESKKFTQLMGTPDSTQTVGNDTFWYYNCKDGKIQIVMSSALLNSGYMAGQINDY